MEVKIEQLLSPPALRSTPNFEKKKTRTTAQLASLRDDEEAALVVIGVSAVACTPPSEQEGDD